MSHKHDYWEKIRSFLIPKLGIITQFVEDVTGAKFYVESETHNEQFVGRVNYTEEEFEEVLHDLGFERNPLAAWKHLESDPKEFEEASFRKVGYDNHPRKQLHLILYDGKHVQNANSQYTYLYAHWEYRWDTDPIKHYRAIDASGPEGVRRMKDILDQEGIIYELIRP